MRTVTEQKLLMEHLENIANDPVLHAMATVIRKHHLELEFCRELWKLRTEEELRNANLPPGDRHHWCPEER